MAVRCPVDPGHGWNGSHDKTFRRTPESTVLLREEPFLGGQDTGWGDSSRSKNASSRWEQCWGWEQEMAGLLSKVSQVHAGCARSA